MNKRREGAVKIFKDKLWPVLTGACLLPGIIAGGYLSGFSRRHAHGLALLLALRPAFASFRDAPAGVQPG